MDSKLFKTIAFDRAAPIAPADFPEWPGEMKEHIYWVARTSFPLDAVPVDIIMKIAADRHYEIFLNGVFTVRNRNFFNGDKYVFSQTWRDGLAAHLKEGRNTVEIVIRSDPWKNKNHRTLRPFLMFEADIVLPGGEIVRVDSNGSAWETSLLSSWRKFIKIGGCGTIAFESVRLYPESESRLSGFSKYAEFSAPTPLAPDFLPAVYEWNDPPVDRIVHTPVSVRVNSRAVRVTQAVEFDLPKEIPYDLECRFEDEGGRDFTLLHSEGFTNDFKWNGEQIGPVIRDAFKWGSWTYLLPMARCRTKKGENVLRMRYLGDKNFVGTLRIAADNLPQLYNQTTWHKIGGAPVRISTAILEPFETGTAIALIDEPVMQPDMKGSLTHKSGGSEYILVDMGEVVSGRIAFSVNSAGTGRFYAVYGLEIKNSVVDCNVTGLKMTEIFDYAKGISNYESFDIRTFRYLAFVFDESSAAAEISGIHVTEPLFLLKDGTSFACGNPKLDAIFTASVRNSEICANELFVDNAEREHSQWADGALYISLSGAMIFGEGFKLKSEKVLREFILAQEPDGQLPGYTPGKWFPRWPLQDHMVMVLLAVYDHFMQTGDLDFLRESYDMICRMIAWWESFRTDGGLVTALDTIFIDVGSHIYSYAKKDREKPTGAITSFNCYYHGALRTASKIAEYLGENADSARFASLAESLRDSINRILFVKEEGIFKDGIINPDAEVNRSQTANILAVLFEVAPKEKWSSIMEKIYDGKTFPQIIRANAFFAWQSCSALFESGHGAIALKWMEDMIWPLIEKGPGTIWENYERYSSRCQSSGATFTAVYARYLAGIHPIEPGYKVIGIDPLIGGTGLNHADATLNTVAGVIRVSWKSDASGRIDYHLTLPENLKESQVRTALPAGSINLRITYA